MQDLNGECMQGTHAWLTVIGIGEDGYAGLGRAARRALFDAQDKVDERREELIAEIEGKLAQQISVSHLFTIRWTLR